MKSTYFGSFRIGKMAKGKQPPTSYIPPTSKSTKTKQSLQWSKVPRFRLEICLLATVGPFFFSFFFFPYLRSRRFAKSSHINNLVCQSTTQCDHESTPTLFYFYFNNKTRFCPVPNADQPRGSPAPYRWRLGSIHHGCGRLPCFSVPEPCGPPPFGCPVYIEPLPLSNIDSARMGRCFSGLRHRLSI